MGKVKNGGNARYGHTVPIAKPATAAAMAHHGARSLIQHKKETLSCDRHRAVGTQLALRPPRPSPQCPDGLSLKCGVRLP